MTGVVKSLTGQQLVERREAIVLALGGDEDAARSAAETYTLDSRGQALVDELDDIDYLLEA
jgi:hypothetical protein